MVIPTSAQEPEAAAKLLNMLYTNDELMKVMVNGEEGVDYEVIDGQSQPKEGQYNMGNYVIGNNLLAHPLYGNGAVFYDRVAATNNAAERSPFMGFVLETGELQDAIASISTVGDQYKATLQCGGWDEAMYNEFMGKLETAGVNEYLNAIQTQLDAWLAAK